MKRAKLTVLRLGRALGGFALARRLTRRGLRILCYHGTWRVADGYRGDAMFMRPDTFRRRMAILRRLGYPVVPLADAVRALRGEATLPPAAVVITIDDGWYGTYADMLPALREHGMPATLYCDTASVQSGQPVPHVMARWLRQAAGLDVLPPAADSAFGVATDLSAPLQARLRALDRFMAAAGLDPTPYRSARAFGYMTPEELRQAAADGLDVQLHTHTHTLHDLSEAAITAELDANRAALAAMLPDGAGAAAHFCYPSGVCSAASGAVLARLQVASATTTQQGIAWPGDDPYYLPRLLDGEQLTELEFEAELSGFADLLRALRASLARCRGQGRTALPGVLPGSAAAEPAQP